MSSMTLLYPLRDYQQSAVDDAVMSLRAGLSGLYVAVTGAGKSLIWAGLLEELPDLVVTAPQIEICAGIYEMLTGINLRDEKESVQRAAYEAARIFTDKRYLSRLKDGLTPYRYTGHDEAHHDDDTHDAIHELCGRNPRVGLTGTEYGGTPQRTTKIRESYGNRVMYVLRDKEAVARGYTTLPTFTTEPILNDEMIEITNGEFNIRETESHFRSKIDFFVGRFAREFDGQLYRKAPTAVCPSVASVEELTAAMTAAGLPADACTAKTKNRNDIFKRTVERRTMLVQNLVVGEGIDIRLRWMYDLNPTMSPMRWRQRVGRLCRPNGESEYISACHNLLRHGYLFDGLIPPTVFREAITVWGADFKPSRRMMSRALGMQGLGKFEPCQVPTKSGELVWLYVLKATALLSYAALLIPHDPKPRYYQRNDVYTGEMKTFEPRPGTTVTYQEKKRGQWQRIAELPEIKGAASYPKEAITTPMINWWRGNRVGLDREFVPNWKEWMVLPILKDTGEELE